MSSQSYYETILQGPTADVSALLSVLTEAGTPIDHLRLHESTGPTRIDDTRSVATLSYDTYPGHMHDVAVAYSADYPQVLISTTFSDNSGFLGAMAHLGGAELYDEETETERVWSGHARSSDLAEVIAREAAALRRSVMTSRGSLSTIVFDEPVEVTHAPATAQVSAIQHHPNVVHLTIEATRALHLLTGEHQAQGVEDLVAQVHGPRQAREGFVPFLDDDDVWDEYVEDHLPELTQLQRAELVTALSAVLFNDAALARADHDSALLVTSTPAATLQVLEQLRERIDAARRSEDEALSGITSPHDIYAVVLAATA